MSLLNKLTLNNNGVINTYELGNVIEGYYNRDNLKFYKDSEYTQEVKLESSLVYISLDTNIQYRYDEETSVLEAIGETIYKGSKNEINALIEAGKIPVDSLVIITDDIEGHDIAAKLVGYDNESSSLEATNVQDAIDEINGNLSDKQDKTDYGIKTNAKTVVGAINELLNKFITKQDKTDNALTTTAKTIVGAINELLGKFANYFTKTEMTTSLGLKQDKTDNTLATTSKTVVGAINELNSNKQNNITEWLNLYRNGVPGLTMYVTNDAGIAGISGLSRSLDLSSNSGEVHIGGFNWSFGHVMVGGTGHNLIMAARGTGETHSGSSVEPWTGVWAKNFQNVSDRNLKDNIDYDINKIEDLLLNLKPCSYEWKEKEYSKEPFTHFGFIAQEVEEEMKNLGIDRYDCGILHKVHKRKTDEQGKSIEVDGYNYCINYIEMISPMLSIIQKQQAKITELEQRLEKVEKATK